MWLVETAVYSPSIFLGMQLVPSWEGAGSGWWDCSVVSSSHLHPDAPGPSGTHLGQLNYSCSRVRGREQEMGTESGSQTWSHIRSKIKSALKSLCLPAPLSDAPTSFCEVAPHHTTLLPFLQCPPVSLP